ncbi:MAG: NlpC/P60 family protein, partial [Spirochaetota bacterium]|nr:NlpC/P60 family protein [Spirochaetota bacterium]
RNITERIIPWAMMEHLEPPEVARIIVYMYHADEAGAPFLDAEDLIPLVAQRDIPLKDFVLMVQYNRETKQAEIPEEIRHSFLGEAVQRKWDGVSILAGGRGLILARSAMLDINKTATLLLNKLPANGARVSSSNIISIIKGIIGDPVKQQNSQKIINNIENAHNAVTVRENSPRVLKNIIRNADQADSNIRKVRTVAIPKKPKKNTKIDREAGIVPEYKTKPSAAIPKSWKTLSRNNLYSSIRPWMGTPYKYGGKTGKGGIDCSGFTRIVLINNKIGVPHNIIGHGTARQRKAGYAIKRRNIRAGDLVFFSASPNRSKVTHVGLATSPGTFAHSCNRGVVHDKLTSKWWKRRYVTSRRVFTQVKD